jgi:class 3 adenylate cyclase
MPMCSRCGEENPEWARFCQACSAPLGPAARPREVRKSVTVVFCDVAGSTALGERLEPETTRRVMTRYFESMRAVVERHGGVVEKFIGDAIMAIFGIPRLHDDDALRAVRAAQDMRNELAVLNKELERDHGVAIDVRIGVNTGVVVAGDPASRQQLVTGDAVNLAARLEQAASAGDVLIGASTHGLVRDAATLEPVEPIAVKGKALPVPAFRLIAVSPTALARARRMDSAMVGRDRERGSLGQAFRYSAGARSCHLVTVLGPAGVGKSRLVAEFLGDVRESARVVQGRCLSYGEGITYFPIREIVEQAADLSDLDRTEEWVAKVTALLDGEDDGRLVAERIGATIGISSTGVSQEEAFWAVRKLLGSLGRKEPLVVVIDDVQWAEPALLDLIEHVADRSRDAAILLVCLARLELLEARPGWVEGRRPNAATISLEPLSEDECIQLIDNLLGRSGLSEEAGRRIAAAAEGNPLFVEEFLSMLIDDGLLRRTDGRWTVTGDLSELTVPPTIDALLSARIDRLPEPERAAIERGAVEGKRFHVGAVLAQSSDQDRREVPSVLRSLARLDLIRPDRPDFAGQEAFGFRHQLIRDAAYGSIPKDRRAELHERFSAWLEGQAGVLAGDLDGIIGYHLEQAYRYHAELGPPDERAIGLSRRGAEHLASAGHGAAARSDAHAAANLFGRAVELLPGDEPMRGKLIPELAWTLIETGELDRALDLVREQAEDEGSVARRDLVRCQLRQLKSEATIGDVAQAAERLLEVFERIGDDVWSVRASLVVAFNRFVLGSCRATMEVLERVEPRADRIGALREQNEILKHLISALLWGPTPAPQAIERIDRIRHGFDQPSLDVFATQVLSALHAMEARFDLSRALADQSLRASREFGLWFLEASAAVHLSYAAQVAGDQSESERLLREGIAALERIGEQGYLSTMATSLAEVLVDQDRVEEAERYIAMARASGVEDDLATQASWRVVRARILVRRGEHEKARRLVEEGATMWDTSDYLDTRGITWLQASEVRRLCGDLVGAAEAAEEAVELFEAKGNVVSAERARAARVALGVG